MTPEQTARMRELYAKLRKHQSEYLPEAATLEEFTSMFPEGDFKWENQEDDWRVYCCGEKDCEQQWHLYSLWSEFERKDGKLSITVGQVDGDGNSDTDYWWEEGDDWDSVAQEMCQSTNSYFEGWASYWLDAAETGKDPCNQSMNVPKDKWVDFCLDSATNMITCLTMKPVEN